MSFFSLAVGVSTAVFCSSLAAAKLAVAVAVGVAGTGTGSAATVCVAMGCCWALPEISKSLALFCKQKREEPRCTGVSERV